MPTGTIARLLIDKGFGFIRDESGIEHFFHRSAVRGAVFELLREGITKARWTGPNRVGFRVISAKNFFPCRILNRICTVGPQVFHNDTSGRGRRASRTVKCVIA